MAALVSYHAHYHDRTSDPAAGYHEHNRAAPVSYHATDHDDYHVRTSSSAAG